MRSALALLLGLVTASSLALAQTPPVVKVVAISPDPTDRLRAGQNLSVRIAYESDRPLRFQARG